MWRKIVVALDGSVSAERALNSAIDLGKQSGASLAIISVVPPHVAYAPAAPMPAPVSDAELESIQKMVHAAAEKARRGGVKEVSTTVVEGVIVDRILEFLEKEMPDLLVVGARGLSLSARLFLGSTSDGVVHHAKCPVLVVKGPKS